MERSHLAGGLNGGGFARVALLVFVATACMHAHAAIFCVQAGDGVGLQTALATAATNDDDDYIMLQGGAYILPSNFLLDYEPTTEHHDLTLAGGFIEHNGNACGANTVWPTTVLDGGLLRLKSKFGATGSMKLTRLIIQNTFSSDAGHPPVEIFGGASATSNVEIDQVRFTGNASTGTSSVYIVANQGSLHVHNSLFASNASFAGASAVRLGTLQISGSACAEIVGSTFSNNASMPASAVDVYANCLAIVANDIFWGNVGSNINFAFPQTTWLSNSDLDDLNAAANTQSANLLSVNPFFNPDFSLSDFSPLHDAGDPGGFFFTVGLYDLAGHDRTIGAKPDIGAYEISRDLIFAHNFDLELSF